MKKGFTLIELLAVIIILAILMIIAVPNILSTLATARSSAFITQAESVYKAAEQQYIIDTMTGTACTCYDKNNLNLGSISSTISFSVQMNTNGTVSSITINDSGQQLKASGTTMNNIALTTYANETLSCSGSSNNNNTPAQPTTYTESLLNGADPVISGGLIPVTLSSTNSDWTVTYANTTQEWYKYGQSRWANAVILVSSPSKTYAVGDTIEHADIQGYFVWIPKYKYKLFNMGNYSSASSVDDTKPQKIEIIFGTSNTTDVLTGDTQSCVTPGTTGESGNCAIDRWMSHPAFTSLNKNGIWVGKFETTGTASNGTINSITVKPGIAPIVSVTNYEMFTKAYSYNRTLDSHMMKNTEWGAVAYLAHSDYGMGKKNIYINNYKNNNQYQTGCVGTGTNTAESTTCTNQWYSTTGYNGSTTGNITGIYDMSGGVWERVAAYRSGTMGSSGFSTTSTDSNYIGTYNAKYFDEYSSDTTYTSWNKRILGDATGELGPFITSPDYTSSWYGDYANFGAATYPWFNRGSKVGNGSYAGLFGFDGSTGAASAAHGFRLVLAP